MLDIRKIKPIIITQIEFDGLKNQKLFLVNEKLKEFSSNNNIPIIKYFIWYFAYGFSYIYIYIYI